MHLPALRQLPAVDVLSVVAAGEESARRAAAEFDVPAWHTSVEAACRDPRVDVIDIVAPPDVHASAAVIAAHHGKHVICIKPLARSLDEARQMISATRSAGVRLLYAENVPFIPAVRRARESVAAGDIGSVYRVKACEGIGEPHASWFFDPQRSGGGAMIDMAVHSIEFCRFFAGASVRSVYAETGTFVWSDHTTAEDTAVLTLRFDNGVIGQCEDSWSLVGAMDSRFEIFGTRGRILVDNLHRQPLQVVNDTGWSYPLPVPGLLADGHLDMLAHFVDCIRSGEPSRSEAGIGLHALAVVEAATRSAATGERAAVHDQVGSRHAG
jgi:predicted dehydrogenase